MRSHCRLNVWLNRGQGPAEAYPSDLKVEAFDAHTVRFTLSAPFAPFLYTLANDGASIINPAVLSKYSDDEGKGWLAENSAGSGPYQVQRWQKGQQVVLIPSLSVPEKRSGSDERRGKRLCV